MAIVVQWWMTDYATEIAECLRQKETKRITFHYQSPQLQYRHYLVDWLCCVAEELKLCNTAVHLAVYLLDCFMDNHSIFVQRLHLVALVCLLVAAKYEEKDNNIPKIPDLSSYINNQYPSTDFISLEIMLLNFLDWNLNIPTAAHFTEYFVNFAVDPVDFISGTPCRNYLEAREAICHHVQDFLDISLHDSEFLRYPPSLVASATVAASRLYLCLKPMWPSSMLNVTSYPVEQLETLVDIFLKAVEDRREIKGEVLETSPDHGYHTSRSESNTPGSEGSKRSRAAGICDSDG